jgi:hypothetical protein
MLWPGGAGSGDGPMPDALVQEPARAGSGRDSFLGLVLWMRQRRRPRPARRRRRSSARGSPAQPESFEVSSARGTYLRERER